MKILKNSFEKETTFTSLEAAKKYYLPENEEFSKEDYIGKNYDADVIACGENIEKKSIKQRV